MGNAYKVEAITIGFVIGAASINVTAAGTGIPFLISLAPTGQLLYLLLFSSSIISLHYYLK
ncbi:hypothetical protein [Clostridium lacusfryxellense]|uniref:hypothetical protein n=1 Tax=Clostridium lacusfryxellense TaxID=205328 RepID=UPI001FEA8D48|nr:hypothetical protein [Clostridium lacusfryxellense]